MDWSTTDWKTAALAIVPDLAGEIVKAETPYLLWIDLHHAFREAYSLPRDDALIGQIYRVREVVLRSAAGRAVRGRHQDLRVPLLLPERPAPAAGPGRVGQVARARGLFRPGVRPSVPRRRRLRADRGAVPAGMIRQGVPGVRSRSSRLAAIERPAR
jgi:hypothetical protein